MESSQPAAWQPVWIVVPAYNEAGNLDATLGALREHGHQVVVVDDGSTDATSQQARTHGVWLLRHVFNCGQGAAIQTGVDFALRQGAASIVTFDADGQHDANDIAQLLQPIREGRAEVVLGSRFLGKSLGIPWSRWIVLKLGVLFTVVTARIRVTDTHNGLRAFTRAAAQRIRITIPGMAHASEILEVIGRQGLDWCEVPVTIRYFEASLAKGQSSWNSLRIVARLVVGRLVR